MKRTLSVLLATIIFLCASFSVTVTAYADYDSNLVAHQRIDGILQNYVDPTCHLDKYELTESEEAELLSVAESATAECTSDYEKISAITEFVAKEIYYDYDYYEDRTTTLFYEPYEVWTNKRTVCEGYARLAKEFLNLLNIPCMCVLAANHKYNCAYDADNDRWIYLDTTWCSGNIYEYGEFEKGAYKASRFDMSLETLSSLKNHEVYELTGIVTDNIKYVIETPKTATDWSNLDEWQVCVAGVTDDFNSAVVDIPGSFDGLDVTTINESAFYGCSTITDVTIPEGIQSIKYRAFGNCTGLASVVIPESVTSMGNSIFRGCTSLSSVTLPEGITSIGTHFFRDCASLEGVTLPKGITTISNYAFCGCTNLASISLPEKVTEIGSYAFRECTKLASLEIPEGVTSISDYLFYKCTGLTSVTIPSGITSIGSSAFYGCTGLTSIPIPEKVTKIGGSAFYGCKNVKSFTIPEGVTSLGSYTFRDCQGLTTFTLPEGITNVGFGSFYNCSNLTSISIPDSVTKIDSYAFCQCYKLEAIDIPQNVTSIGMYAFRSCTDLSEIEIPEGVTLIDYGAFQSCVGLSKVSIPDSVLTIDDYAFRHCALKSVVIPKNVTTLGDYVFQGCGGLKKVVMYDSLTSIGVEAVTAPTVIYGYENTTAHSYAIENGISYIPIQLSSENSEVSVDFNNKIIFSSVNSCTDIAELVSTSQGCALSSDASLVTGDFSCIGTGSGVAVKVDDMLVDEYLVVVEGDLNGDGVCDALDAAQTALVINGFREIDELQIYAANGCVSDTIDVVSYQNVVNRVLSA